MDSLLMAPFESISVRRLYCPHRTVGKTSSPTSLPIGSLFREVRTDAAWTSLTRLRDSSETCGLRAVRTGHQDVRVADLEGAEHRGISIAHITRPYRLAPIRHM